MYKKYDNFSSKHIFHSFFILRISKYCLFKDRLHYHFWPYIILPLSTGSCQTYVKYSINMTCSETCFRIHLQFIFGNKLFFRLLTIWLQKNACFHCPRSDVHANLTHCVFWMHVYAGPQDVSFFRFWIVNPV